MPNSDRLISMAVKDEKMADADAEQAKLKKQKHKKKGQKGEEDKEADMSEEDLELKKNLELMLERAKDTDAGVQKAALDGIAREIRSGMLNSLSTENNTIVAQLCLQGYSLRPYRWPAIKADAEAFAFQGVYNINDLSPKTLEVFKITLQGTQRPVREFASQQSKQGALGRCCLGHGHYQRKRGCQGKLALQVLTSCTQLYKFSYC